MAAQGPPTPPPTTETELLDEARDSAASTSASTNVEQPTNVVPNNTSTNRAVYQEIFPLLSDLTNQANFKQLVRVAELHDFDYENDNSPSRLFLTVPLVLAYLIEDDLIPAQFALTRLPENLQAIPLSQSLMGILASTRERKYEEVYSRAQKLHQLALQPDFPDEKLGSLMATLLTSFIDAFRQRAFVLVSRAYSSISVTLAQKYLGVSEEQLFSVTHDNGWRYENSNKLLYPIAKAEVTNPAGAQFLASSLDTFHIVANGVTILEA